MSPSKLRVTVLVDNNTYIDQYFYGEPAVSYYIEDEGKKILFDVGYSDIFLKNAQTMGVDLGKVSTVAISHGHNDHTGGFKFLDKGLEVSGLEVIAHPDAFKKKYFGKNDIGAPYGLEEMRSKYQLALTREPVKISPNITFLGEIPQINDFEIRKDIGVQMEGGLARGDLVMDDTALVCEQENGLFIITGCSHSGICNIMEYAKQVCQNPKITGVLGGFHLFKKDEQLAKTIDYFEKNSVENIYPSHCVSFEAKAHIHRRIPVHETGVGMVLNI